MLKILPLLLVLFLIFDKKSNSTAIRLNPDYTIGLTGIYPVVFYRVGNQPITLPSNSSTGHFDVTKIDTTHVQAKLIMTTAEKSTVWSTYIFALKRDSTHQDLYHITMNGQKAGIISASNIFLKLTASDSTTTVIRSKR